MGTMAGFVAAGKVDELPDGAMKKVTAQGYEILLARAGAKYYAADNRCPHLGADLSQGKLEGTVVTCPRHGSQFDLTDGRVIRWTNWSGLVSKLGRVLKPPRQLTVYKTKVEAGRVLIEI